MKSLNILKAILTVSCICLSAHIFAADTIDADDFVNEASAKGIAEIETGKMALEKSDSQQVKAFAQKMIDDHTTSNAKLATIARSKQLEVASDVELKNKAKAFILRQRDGESFDEAYANNQVMAHQETIKLFQRGINSPDPEINAYAKETLPKLEHHLQMAQDLARSTKAVNERNTDRPANRTPAADY